MFALPFRSQSNRKPNRSRSWRPLIETMEPRTLLSAVLWTGKGGDNNWDTAANWSTDSVPGPHDDVTINIPANVVHSANVTDSINSLTSTEPLTISGGTLSIAEASTINSTLSITGGTLTGTGAVSVSGLLTLTTGTLSGSGAINADGGMLLNPPNQVNGLNFVGCTINNPAGQTATWTGNASGGIIFVSDDSVFNNLGTFTTGASGEEYAGDGDNSSFNNMGTLTTSAFLSFSVNFNMIGGSLNVTGSGNVDLFGGTSTGGSFSITSAAGLGLFDGYSVDPTTTFSGTGSLYLNSSTTLVLPANYNFAGLTSVYGGLQVDGSLIGSGINVSGGTLSGSGTVGPLSVGVAEVSPGDDSNPGILQAQGPADFAGGVEYVGDEEQGLQEFSTLTVQLNGPKAGTGYSQLNVAGAVDLAEASLNASLGFTPTNAEQFTIIKSTAPIEGTFNGLPEGASLTIGNTPFTISYHGGDGDDVVLTQANTAVSSPTVTGISPASGPAAGDTVVTITGTGFTGATAVDFGTNPATGMTVVNGTTITADSPAGSGAVDVTVVTPGGTSAATAADRFTYTQVAAAPAVVSVERFGFHMHPTTLVLTFNVPLNPARAQDANNYQIVAMAGGEKDAVVAGHVTRVRAAVYNAAALTVTLYPRQRLNIHNFYRLTVNGVPPNGLRSASGIPFDSQGNGDPGKNYETILSWKNLVVTPAQARRYFHGKAWQG